MDRLLALARAAVLPALCVAIAGYFGFHAVASDSGLIAWGGYRAERTELEAKAVRIAADKAALTHRVALLDPRHTDPDYADELVRENLGVVRPDEVVVTIKPGD